MKNKNIFKILVVVFVLITALSYSVLFVYRNNAKQNEKYIKANCLNLSEDIYDNENESQSKLAPFVGIYEDPDSCYCRMYSYLLPHFLVYKVKLKNNNSKFIHAYLEEKSSDKEGFMIPLAATENNYATINTSSDNEYLIDYDVKLKEFYPSSSENVSEVIDKLKKLSQQNKTAYMNFDISFGKSKEDISDIFKYSDNITGITLFAEIEDLKDLKRLKYIFETIEKNFILVYKKDDNSHVFNGCECRYTGERICSKVYFVYINKNLVDKKYLPLNQNFYKKNNPLITTTINPVVVINEKIRTLKK